MMKFRKKLGKKGVAAVVAAAVVVLLVAFSAAARARSAGVHTNISYTTLKKTDLQDTVSVSGAIESGESTNVYTTLNYPVKTLNVGEGDAVKKGDVLAVLDTAGLESDVEQAQYSTKSAEDAAALNLQKAKSDYENAVYLNDHNMNSDLVTANSALNSARVDLKTSSDSYDYDKFLYDNGQLSKMELDQAEAKKETSQINYDKAESTLAFMKNKASQDLAALKNAYDAAQSKYDDKSQRTALEKQEKALKDAVIVSPADGTVTACNATVGSVPTGILFTVDDLSDLVVNAEVREYDVGDVKPGQAVSIETDATGSKKLAGSVESVAPSATSAAATPGAAETAAGSGSPTFTVKIRITGSDPALKIGMNARLNIVRQEKSDIYAVPYDALVDGGGSGSFVYAAVQDGKSWKAKKIPVQTGLENDVSEEISASSLQDGMRSVGNPDSLSDGSTLVFAQGG